MKLRNKEAEWDKVLSAAAHLQGNIKNAVLVGGTAAIIFAEHRTSYDTDHVLTNLRESFPKILEDLESVAGWKTARVKAPVLILGSLNGVETGIRQLIRSEPLETTEIHIANQKITVPTEAEILRIKAALILKRNATRDYLDFAALSNHLGLDKTIEALKTFDKLYPQENGCSALKQLYTQLAQPMPYDYSINEYKTYKNLDEKWQSWDAVIKQCNETAYEILNTFSSVLEIKQTHQHLLDVSQSYDEQLKTYLIAKESQVDRLETKLNAATLKQKDKLKQTEKSKPGLICSLWRGTAWENQKQAQRTRLRSLENRLSLVKYIGREMTGNRLLALATKKLERHEPELVVKHREEKLEAQTQQMAMQEKLQKENKLAKTQSLGMTRTLGH